MRPRPEVGPLTDPGLPADPPTVGLPYERVTFGHNAERQLARLFDFYAVHWEYEPHTFVLSRSEDGHPTSAFAPDFWLPGHDRYVEVTTMEQRLVTRKNRKLRQLRELHPGIDITLIYQRDYLELLVRFGLEAPEQHQGTPVGSRATEPLGLLGLGGAAAGVESQDGPSAA